MTTNFRPTYPPTDEPSDWLGTTRMLDLDDSRLRIQAMRITQLATTDVQKAILIHDFIKSMPFGCVAGFDHVPAVSVLKSGHGDCHTKGTLFVALLRCAGVPARLRFVTLTGAFLHGIIDIGQSTITHAVGEVYLQESWTQTDTYVTDSLLEAQAVTLLTQQNINAGYGVHRQGNRFWNGWQHAHGQYSAADPSSLPSHDWGVAHDPEQFYSSNENPQLHMGWLTRAKWMIAAGVVNRRVQKVRETV
jgi:Transglutaminase-like superfamily